MGNTELELKGKTVAELQKIAASAGVSRTKGVKKADLIGAIVGQGGGNSSNGAAAKPARTRSSERSNDRPADRSGGDDGAKREPRGDRRPQGRSDSDGPREERGESQRGESPRSESQRSESQRSESNRQGSESPRSESNREERNEGSRNDGPRGDSNRGQDGRDRQHGQRQDRQRGQAPQQSGSQGGQQGGSQRDNERRERRRRKKGKGGGQGGGYSGGQGGGYSGGQSSGEGHRGGGRLPQGIDRDWTPEDLEAEGAVMLTGILDMMPDGYGFVRAGGYMQTGRDAYVPQQVVRRLSLRKGDEVRGWVRPIREGEKYAPLLKIEQINDKAPELAKHRVDFKDLTPLFPNERFRLEWGPKAITERVIDLIAPIGKGQRCLIVSPPKAGKTTVLKQIANGIRANTADVHLIVLLVDERPEEVTDWKRTVKANEVAYSTFDRPASEHTQVAELVLARAQRLVEQGRDVVIMLDSITRLARAYNLAAPASGRILSGGVDSGALYPPKRFFGAARNIEEGGSMTIVASALVDTGSKMDEVIFEEFKGTGNSEIRLDRGLSEKRIFPAIDIEGSSTRKEELLYTREELPMVWRWRRLLAALDPRQAMELLRDKMLATETNDHLLQEIAKMKNVD